MKFIIKHFDDLKPAELYEIIQERIEIFVVEQEIMYNDLDDKDQRCWHMLGEVDGKIVGSLRIVPVGVSYPDAASIGRFVVLEQFRKNGYARQMINRAIDFIKSELNEKNITISGQAYLTKFYESVGFKVVSDIYQEDGLPHVRMELETL